MDGYQIGKDIQIILQRIEHIEAGLQQLSVANAKYLHEGPNLEIGSLASYTELQSKPVEESLRASRSIFEAYAPPNFWGTWVVIRAHGGSVNYDIEYEPLGDTQVLGEINYYSSNGWRTESFFKSTSISTGNAWAQVSVRFMGIPLGSVVRGFITP